MKRFIWKLVGSCCVATLQFGGQGAALGAISQSSTVYRELYNFLLEEDTNIDTSDKSDLGLNRVYTKLMVNFIMINLCKNSSDFKNFEKNVDEKRILTDAFNHARQMHTAFAYEQLKHLNNIKENNPEVVLAKAQDVINNLNSEIDWYEKEKLVLEGLGVDGYFYHYIQDYDLNFHFPKPALNK